MAFTKDEKRADKRSLDKLPPLNVVQGRFHAYFIFDVADSIDLAILKDLRSDWTKSVLVPHAVPSATFVQVEVAPLMTRLPDLRIEGENAAVRIKFYDYGAVSIRLSLPFTGAFPKIIDSLHRLRQSDMLFRQAKEVLNQSLTAVSGALKKQHDPVMEDYYVVEVNAFDRQIGASELLREYKQALSILVLGETRTLTASEEDESLRLRFSYFESDLSIIQWDAAFIFDTNDGAEVIENILEFANAQLVELRTYDRRLNDALSEVYTWKLARAKPHWLSERALAANRTDQLRTMVVDIRELTDRSCNALKITGDAFYARLYRGIATRLGLSDWQQQIEYKLSALGEIYRFATDQAQHARSDFLEIVVIILIAVEIGVSLIGMIK